MEHINTDKARYWTFIVFEDNYIKHPNWLAKLCDTHVRFVVSPLHDKDLWSEEDKERHPNRFEGENASIVGQPKTPHYHVIVHMDDNSTFKTVKKELCEPLNLCNPWRVISPNGLYRYFCHLDNLEKHKYDVNEIKHYNGSEAEDYILQLSESEKSKILQTIIERMYECGATKFQQIYEICAKYGNPSWYRVVHNHAFLLKQSIVDNCMKREQADRVEDVKHSRHVKDDL